MMLPTPFHGLGSQSVLWTNTHEITHILLKFNLPGTDPLLQAVEIILESDSCIFLTILSKFIPVCDSRGL